MQATRLLIVLLVSFLVSPTADSLNAQTITHVPLYTYNFILKGALINIAVSDAGDVNGDGYDDLIIGVPYDNDNQNPSDSGRARVLSGIDGSILYTFDGDNAQDSFGSSVSGAGDVNGDGRADLVVGAPKDDNNGFNSGFVRVLSGSDGSVLHYVNGDNAGAGLGISVSDAGDLNGDGFDDLIFGSNTGSARVLSGSDGSILYNFDDDIAGDFGDSFDTSVSGAGDVNGDGTPDLIVRAAVVDNSGAVTRKVRVLSGSDGSVLYTFDKELFGGGVDISVSDAGDVNGDGFDDLIIGAPTDGINDLNGGFKGTARVLSGSDGSVLYNFGGDSFRDGFGISVSGAGDVNGDGTADLVVGAPRDDNNGDRSGSARVLSGSDGSILYTFNGDGAFDLFGTSVSGAGDVNGDGIDDFIVGTSLGNNGSGYARVFVSQILGDCNVDGVVNFLDIQPFISILSAADYLGQADIDQNGVVDFLDIQHFIALLSS